MNKIQLVLFYIIVCSTVALQAPALFAGTVKVQNNRSSSPFPPALPTTRQIAWMGLSTGPVPAILRDHLSRLIPSRQGIMVTEVSSSSPAATAGLHRTDVLLSYDNQRLYSPRQLSGLVRSDRPDRTVSVQVVQQGQLKTLEIRLGKQNRPPPTRTGPFDFRPFAPPIQHSFDTNPLAWDSFESVRVNTLANGRYHAEVMFKNKNNETKKFTFEGKRDEIIEQIHKQTELPADKKTALLKALNMRQGKRFEQPPFFQAYPYNRNFNRPFNQGYFWESPFDDPFFQQFFQRHTPYPEWYRQ